MNISVASDTKVETHIDHSPVLLKCTERSPPSNTTVASCTSCTPAIEGQSAVVFQRYMLRALANVVDFKNSPDFASRRRRNTVKRVDIQREIDQNDSQ